MNRNYQTVLALDTSSEVCSVALYCNEKVFSRQELTPNQHGDVILAMLESLLAENDLTFNKIDLIAFGQGPGSFTGLRIAAAVVQGLSLAYDIPVSPISSLQILAQATYEKTAAEKVFVALDARKSEVYFGHYHLNQDKGYMVSDNSDKVASPSDITLSDNPTCVGIGCQAYLDVFSQQQPSFSFDKDSLYPLASDLICLVLKQIQSGDVTIGQALPVYIRNDIAKKKA